MWSKSAGSGLYQHSDLLALGVPHGVTTRPLGNMKDAEARGLALSAGGAVPESLKVPTQVHGKRVVRWEDAGPRPPEADAMVSDRPGAVMGVYVADCQPVFLWERTGLALGLAHLGWRGTAEGLALELATVLVRDFGLDPRDLKAAVGPHIRACCYDVGPDVAARFPEEARRKGAGGRDKLELSEATRLQLVEAGMRPEDIDVEAPCTGCRPEEFFSFRREKADLRMLAFVAKS